MPENHKWQVGFRNKAKKQCGKIPTNILAAVDALVVDLKSEGPERINWPHYGKIVDRDGLHHCHLNKGRPCYVAIWKVLDKTKQKMEIIYVGTHENANYRRIN